MNNYNNNNDKPKFKGEVIKEVEGRNKTFQPGEILVDTDNSYMYAMSKQGKIRKLD